MGTFKELAVWSYYAFGNILKIIYRRFVGQVLIKISPYKISKLKKYSFSYARSRKWHKCCESRDIYVCRCECYGVVLTSHPHLAKLSPWSLLNHVAVAVTLLYSLPLSSLCCHNNQKDSTVSEAKAWQCIYNLSDGITISKRNHSEPDCNLSCCNFFENAQNKRSTRSHSAKQHPPSVESVTNSFLLNHYGCNAGFPMWDRGFIRFSLRS